jgi:hypothetical protein
VSSACSAGRDDLRVVRTAVALMHCGPRGGGPSPLQRGRDDLRVVRMIRGRDDLRVVRIAAALMHCGPRGGGPSPVAAREG